MDKNSVYKNIDELRSAETSDMLIKDRLLNYLEANVDEFVECFSELDNIKNNHVKQAECSYNKPFFDTANGHIDQCKIVWGRDDVSQTAKDMQVTLTEDEIDEVLYLLVYEHDAEHGCCWETIRSYINNIVRGRK